MWMYNTINRLLIICKQMNLDGIVLNHVILSFNKYWDIWIWKIRKLCQNASILIFIFKNLCLSIFCDSEIFTSERKILHLNRCGNNNINIFNHSITCWTIWITLSISLINCFLSSYVSCLSPCISFTSLKSSPFLFL